MSGEQKVLQGTATIAANGRVDRNVRPQRPRYCPCYEETPDPCPACGATVSGNDPVRGVCQATHNRPPSDYSLSLILTDRNTGRPI